LGDLLPCTEAVVNRATLKAVLPQVFVNAATEVRLQMVACVPCFLVDREVCRGQECWGNAAESEAPLAISL